MYVAIESWFCLASFGLLKHGMHDLGPVWRGFFRLLLLYCLCTSSGSCFFTVYVL
uniref:Uncharacterized protein n=1 Tax=Arundo donax TaxID=35708 RepID=A0A0A9ENA9_ARUDO